MENNVITINFDLYKLLIYTSQTMYDLSTLNRYITCHGHINIIIVVGVEYFNITAL